LRHRPPGAGALLPGLVPPALVALLAMVAITAASCSATPAEGSATSPSSPRLLWPAPTTDVTARVGRAGLPLLTSSAFVQHIHAHLDIFVNGRSAAVPANLGIDYVVSQLSPLHTHDESGVVHIEAQDLQTFTLGQLFTEWGVALNARCLATFCAPATPVSAYVNGAAFAGDPSSLVLHRHDEIALVAGAPPTPIPTQFDFPRGY
jgi:hypothetical protein